jgi:hypothetical protein
MTKITENIIVEFTIELLENTSMLCIRLKAETYTNYYGFKL